MTTRLTIEASRDGLTGSLQVSINELDENDLGHGHRLLGPKFSGSGEMLARRDLTGYDADAIRNYLDAVFPQEPAAQFPTVTLCGSMRFYSRMLEVAAQLTSAGRIVLMPHDASLTGIPNKTALEHGAMLDAMHRAKIRASQSVYVVNTGGYIGESTRGEIAYATELGIPVEYDEAVAAK